MFKVLLIGILAVTIAPAQRGGGGGRGGGNSNMNIPMGGPVVKNRLEQMTEALQLSKDQKKDVKTLMDEAHKEAAPVRDQLVKSRAHIASAVQSGKQEEIDAAVKSHADLETQMATIEMKAFAGIYKSLDSDQKQKSRAAFQMMPGIFTHKNWTDVEQ
jgi:hypothetical protein